MGKNEQNGSGERRVTSRPAGGGAYPHLWPVRAPMLAWISRDDLAVLDDWLRLVGAEGAREGGVPAPTVEAAGEALAADLAWLGDFLAWIAAYRENAELRRVSDLRVGRAAAAAAGWLVGPVGALSGRFGAVPPTWNEEEALRCSSRLFLPERFREGLEWMVSLAYVVGSYYETPEIDPELHLPGLLEAAKTEATVLLGDARSLAAEPAATAQERRLLGEAVEALSRVAALHPDRVAEQETRWHRRPAVPSRRA